MAAAIGAGLPVGEPTGQHRRRHRRRHERGRGDLARRDRRLAVDPHRRRRARRGDHQLRQARVQADDRPADGRGDQARDRLGVPARRGGAGRDPRPRPRLRAAEDGRADVARRCAWRSRSRSRQIIDAVKETLDRTPPELASDIMDRGHHARRRRRAAAGARRAPARRDPDAVPPGRVAAHVRGGRLRPHRSRSSRPSTARTRIPETAGASEAAGAWKASERVRQEGQSAGGGRRWRCSSASP